MSFLARAPLLRGIAPTGSRSGACMDALMSVARFIGALIVCCAWICQPVQAHPMPSSAVLLDFQQRAVQAELHLPLADLEIGFTHDPADPDVSVDKIGRVPFTSAPDAILPSHQKKLEAYLVRHVRPVAPDGRPWSVVVDSIAPPTHERSPVVVARLTLSPPAGEPVGRFKLNYDVITHEVVTHEALVSVRSDWNSGKLGDEPQLLGRIRWVVKSVDVDQPEGGAWAGLKGAIKLGMQHIAEGTDHLMFLLVLLLPAPLLASQGRWSGHRGVRGALFHLLGIVTAFTVGHSITLISGGQGWLTLPPGPVEVAIAVSILVSAVHAWRPLFHGREKWIAGAFGLVHGCAFASVVAEFHFDAWHRTVAMLGFNVGIELMQLVVVAAVLPALLLVADLAAYRFFRTAGAAFAAVAALGWIAERTVGLANPLNSTIASIASHAPMIIGSATLAAAMGRILSTRRRKPAMAAGPDLGPLR